MQVKIEARKIEVKCVFPFDHVAEAVPHALYEIDTAAFIRYFNSNFFITNMGEKCLPALVEMKPLYDINSYSFIFEMTCKQTIDQLAITCNLFLDICDTHKGLADITLADKTSQLEFSHEFNSIEIPVTDLLVQWGEDPFEKAEQLAVKTNKPSKDNTPPPGQTKSKDTVKQNIASQNPKIDSATISGNYQPDPLILPSSSTAPSHLTPPSVLFKEQSTLDKCLRFLVLGIEHILTGYDHILFLIGLLLIAVRFWDIVRIITSFTVAHSITLLLSAFGIFILPSRLTESMIALSISYVAFENIYYHKSQAIPLTFLKQYLFNPDKRWAITFLFGLIHGFGFSFVLREIGLPKEGLVLSLLSFNLGVELGQLAIVFILLPLLWYIRKKNWQHLFMLIASGIIGVVGLFWFIQRAVS